MVSVVEPIRLMEGGGGGGGGGGQLNLAWWGSLVVMYKSTNYR